MYVYLRIATSEFDFELIISRLYVCMYARALTHRFSNKVDTPRSEYRLCAGSHHSLLAGPHLESVLVT